MVEVCVQDCSLVTHISNFYPACLPFPQRTRSPLACVSFSFLSFSQLFALILAGTRKSARYSHMSMSLTEPARYSHHATSFTYPAFLPRSRLAQGNVQPPRMVDLLDAQEHFLDLLSVKVWLCAGDGSDACMFCGTQESKHVNANRSMQWRVVALRNARRE